MSPDPVPPDDPVPLLSAPVDDGEPSVFTPAEYDPLAASGPAPVRRPTPPPDRSRLRMWLFVGGLLWTVGLAGWMLLFFQGCGAEGEPAPAAKQRK